MIVRGLERHNSASLAFLEQRGSSVVARRDELVDCARHPAVVVEENGAVVGVLTYIITASTCEILTLHAARSWQGIGTALVAEVAAVATTGGCSLYTVTTTNDNVDALRFYQRRGFRIAELRRGATDRARQTLKPQIPLLGAYGIALRDEIELQQELRQPPASS